MGVSLRFIGPTRRVEPTLRQAIGAAPVTLHVAGLAAALTCELPLPTTDATIYREVAEHVEVNDVIASLVAKPSTPSDAALVLREAMQAVIARSMGDARCIAVLTGGGLDSSGLLAMALRCGRETGVRVFAVALDYEARGNDRPHLAALEKHLGCEVFRVRPEDATDCFHHFERGVDAMPFVWPSGCMEAKMQQRAKLEGAEIVLSGVGSDELFDGEPQSLASMLWRHPFQAYREAQALRAFWQTRSRFYDWVVRPALLPLVPRHIRWVRSSLHRLAAPSWAGPKLRHYLTGIDRARRERRLGIGSPPPLLPWEAEHHHTGALLFHQYDQAAGIVSRRPFLERPLRRMVASFDPTWIFVDRVRRGLFRRAVRDLLPASVVDRLDKAEFESANRRFIQAIGGAERLRPLASVARLADLGLAEPKRFAEAFERFAQKLDSATGSFYVWSALAVESFLRQREQST